MTMREARQWEEEQGPPPHPANILCECPWVEILIVADLGEATIQALADLWTKALLADLERRPPKIPIPTAKHSMVEGQAENATPPTEE